MKPIIAAIQLVSTSTLEDNLRQTQRCLQAASIANAKVIVLPENFAFMGIEEKDKQAIKEHYQANGRIQTFLSEQAKQLGVYIVGGTIPLASEYSQKVYASSLVFNDEGECIARYDKIHLFDVQVPGSDEAYQESASVAVGTELTLVETPVGKLGLSVCYDLRFPELYRTLSAQGADLLLVPSAFTQLTGQAHWEILLRARAIENLCYVVGSNQGGTHDNGRKTYGHSMIINPWGSVLSEIEEGVGFIKAEIDLDYLSEVRQTFPAMKHRRLI